jgi:hypothetical protein
VRMDVLRFLGGTGGLLALYGVGMILMAAAATRQAGG